MFSDKYTTAKKAVEIVKSGDRIYIQAAAATPKILTDALAERANELKNVELCQVLTCGHAAYADAKYKGSFYVNSFFLSDNVRHTIAEGNGSYTPVFLSDIPHLFTRGIMPLDGVFVSVSPPDKHGFCSLGTSVEATQAAINSARYVIAQVNENMPRTFGHAHIHISKITKMVYHSSPIYQIQTMPQASGSDEMIAKNVANLIEDGSTLQMGIGTIPDAVLSKLENFKDLGVHTEMLTDGVVNLVEKGVITGKRKKIDVGKIVCTFALGSKKLYDFMDNNTSISITGSDYTNDADIISKNDKMVSVNSAIEVDLTGQVCADSIGMKMYSGVGGQIDYVRGAFMSLKGKSIIVLPSVTKDGKSKIVPYLKTGAGIVTTRAHVQYVVTEYGIADLRAKNFDQRRKMLINIAHPDHRERIDREFYEIWKKDNIR